MSTSTVPFLYTEARVSIEPTVPGSTLHIATGSRSSSSLARRSSATSSKAYLDEDAFTRQYLATNASIFFRKPNRTPRNILWRVLDDSRLLTLQSTDLLQERKTTQESVLTFAISFDNQIRPNGIAFADSDDSDALHVFVLTISNELITITLRKDVLLKSHVPDTSIDSSTFFKTYLPTSFSFRHPYKLVAITSQDLLVSLHDGGLLRLERQSGDNGSTWRETFFSEGGWAPALRGFLPWKSQNAVRYGHIDLRPTTIIAVEPSPDKSHIFTLSLDHTVKAWNAQTGKVGIEFDLLGEPRNEKQPPAQALIDPYHGTLMRIRNVAKHPAGDLYYVITHSPKDRQFKFWGIRDADSAEHGVRDLHPDVKMIPPVEMLMDTNAWQITDFDLKPGTGWRKTRMWIRARSGAVSRIFTVEFDLLAARDDLEDCWRNRWAAVDEGANSIDRLLDGDAFPDDAHVQTYQAPSQSESWLKFLLFPGRFSQSSLETALIIYRKGVEGQRAVISDPRTSLQERLTAAVVSAASKKAGQRDAYEEHRAKVAEQWNVYFGLVRHLHQRRSDTLSLCLDLETSLAWSVRADQVAPIRACSQVEILRLNEPIFAMQDDGWINNSLPLADHLHGDACISIARLCAAAKTFRASLSPSPGQIFADHASVCALRHVSRQSRKESRQDGTRSLSGLYGRCQFSTQISDEDFNRLSDDMQDLGGLGGLDNSLFLAAIDLLTEQPRGHSHDKAITRYGARVTLSGSQDALILGREILLDLLALVVFVSQDLEPDELAAAFDAPELYIALIQRLKEYGILVWLATHMRTESSKSDEKAVASATDSDTYTTPTTLTLSESIFIGDWQTLQLPADSWPALITYWSRAWTFGPNLSSAYDGVAQHIMSNLLRRGNIDLAADFAKFLPSTPWAAYLTGRLDLLQGQHVSAAEQFKRSAKALSSDSGFSIKALDSAGMLTAIEQHSFGQGLPRFYLHTVSLFESRQLPSFAADFADMALTHVENNGQQDIDSSIADIDRRKHGAHDSPATARVELAMEEINYLRISELYEDIVGRLFSAALQTSRFNLAFFALVKIRNPAVRRSCLQQLLQSVLQAQSISTLLALDWPRDIRSDVDAILLSLARKSLNAASTSLTGLAPYHAVLYAWRVHRDDFRGAAEVVYEYLQHVKTEQSYSSSYNIEDGRLLELYLMLINTLASCGSDDAWILAQPQNEPVGKVRQTSFTKKLTADSRIGSVQAGTAVAAGLANKGRRTIITLDDVRREYVAELDRRSEMAQGRFGIIGDEMDLF